MRHSKFKAAAALIIGASLAQGAIFPSIALGDHLDTDVPTYTVEAMNADGTPAASNDFDDQTTSPANNGKPSTSTNVTPDATDTPSTPDATEPSQQPSSGAGTDTDADADAGTNDDADATTPDDGQQQPNVDVDANTDPDADTADTKETPRLMSAKNDKDSKEQQDTVTPPSPDYTGWVDHKGKRYWFDNGTMAKGKEIFDQDSNAWYFVESDGTMAKDKDAYIRTGSGKWIRLAKDGKRVHGENYRNGSWYYFDTKTGAMLKGVRLIPVKGGGSKWVYYDLQTGKMAHGEKYLNYDKEHTGWYYFHPDTGAMQYGFIYHGNAKKWVFYHRQNGKMLYGEQCIDKGWYFFNKTTGARAHGFTNLPGKRVFYNTSNGRMVYGATLINDRPYFFDKTTGRQWSKNELVNKIVSTARSFRLKHPDCPGALALNGGIICPQGPCMSFVWYVFHAAGLDVFLCNGGAVNGRPSGIPDDNYSWYAKRGRISSSPKVGDIVFWRFTNGYSWSTNASHAGIVVNVAPGKITVMDAAFNNIDERPIYSSYYPSTPMFATPYYG
ncbi:CHAP domain-containing protein [Bifidobacterium gallicum]|uniref:Cell wall-binding repeat protein n=1 Tax=Bifidobacterium gallicum DSM 20093 = LMG 11596 TaxID=561180 RepID=D1NVS0_9BIFI|nr:CHAP domain-containing protein [Bifidobacterium gallicum]EFA22921.1 cell wall-binding repeat protein [Bifidobacterium gallicum DSM 20093 = LMG 11596]KFI59382.1 surface protective antigen spaA [Bifidobacterium gallicum DSM 20093 = LMG 11596]